MYYWSSGTAIAGYSKNYSFIIILKNRSLNIPGRFTYYIIWSSYSSLSNLHLGKPGGWCLRVACHFWLRDPYKCLWSTEEKHIKRSAHSVQCHIPSRKLYYHHEKWNWMVTSLCQKSYCFYLPSCSLYLSNLEVLKDWIKAPANL